MKCAYCLEDMNEGASVCRVCRRTQPLQQAARNRRILIIAIALFAVVGTAVTGYFIYDSRAEDKEIRAAVQCYNNLSGGAGGTPEKQREILDKLNKVTHLGWRTNLKLLNARLGCVALNRDF
jgi:hypothetical protein